MGCILVTGATGFLGSHLVRRLAAMGADVLGSGRDAKACDRLKEAGVPVLRHDLANPLDISLHPTLVDVTRIVHCAALSAPFGPLAEFHRANVLATTNLVAFARQRNVGRFVHISTPSVYFDFRDQLNVGEYSFLPKPVNAYARTKRQAEDIVLSAPQIHPVVLRPRGLYGPGDISLLPRLLRVARKRPLPLFRNGVARIDLTFVEDLVDAIVAALNADQRIDDTIFNISGGEVLPITEIANRACLSAGLRAQWKPVRLGPALFAAGLTERVAAVVPGRNEPPVTRYGLGLFAYAQSLDISRAKRLLAWQPKVTFDEGLERTFKNGAVS